MSWSRSLINLMRSSFGAVVASSGYVLYTDNQRYPRMMSSYRHGNILPPLADNRFEVTYHPRPEAEKALRQALSPHFANEYYLVNGETGSGKTRLVVEVVRDMISSRKQPGAPVYVTTMQGKSFSESLAEAVKFCFDEHISFKFFASYALKINDMPSLDEGHKLTRTLEAIEKSAFRYSEKYGRPVVLVIDGIDTLTKHRPATLLELQEKAKLWADTNIVKVIFISNDEKTEAMLQQNASAWSRAAVPIHISDLSNDEALSFLTNSQFLESEFPVTEPISAEDAHKIIKLVGGRMHHLIAFKRDHHHGIDKKVTARLLKSREREKFLLASRIPSQLKVIKTLHAAPNKMMNMATLAQKTSSEDIEALLESNIIRIERKGKVIRAKFESKLAEKVVEEFE